MRTLVKQLHCIHSASAGTETQKQAPGDGGGRSRTTRRGCHGGGDCAPETRLEPRMSLIARSSLSFVTPKSRMTRAPKEGSSTAASTRCSMDTKSSFHSDFSASADVISASRFLPSTCIQHAGL